MQEVLADNPLIYLRFNETSGSAAVNSGSLGPSHNATYNGNYTLAQGGAIQTDAANTAVRLTPDTVTPANGGHILLNTAVAQAQLANSYSVELWFKTEERRVQDLVAGVDNAAQGNHAFLTELLAPTAGGTPLRYLHRSPASTTGGQNINPSSQMYTFGPEGRWHHFVAVLDKVNNVRQMKLYLDGNLDSVTSTATADINVNVLFALGRLAPANAGRSFAGLLDEFAVYNYALDNPNGDSSTADSRVLPHYQAAIPEPTGLALAAAAAAATALRRHRRAVR